MSRFTEPLFGLLVTLLVWWLLGDVLDQFEDAFLSVIAFGAAVIFTVVWVYDLFETLTGRGAAPDSDS